MSIKIENLYHTYQKGSPYETHALKDINLEIQKGEFIGIIGHTGSGKSTLVQHLNGLLLPTSGKVQIDDMDISDKKNNIKEIRKKVGLVFQYPEHQLFEETVEKDVAFGPQNLGLDEKEISKRVKNALNAVYLDYSKIKEKSPFNLSGGQKRRVAIAGILAMKPEYLVLDEPTAGLDPKGREEILSQIKKLHKESGITIILVSHSMDDVARFADRLIVMHDAGIEMQGKPKEVFKEYKRIKEIGLGVPMITELMYSLKEKGYDVDPSILSIKEAKNIIINIIKEADKNA